MIPPGHRTTTEGKRDARALCDTADRITAGMVWQVRFLMSETVHEFGSTGSARRCTTAYRAAFMDVMEGWLAGKYPRSGGHVRRRPVRHASRCTARHGG